MSNVHILPDKNLGGVLREYVEVKREARVGDLLKINGSNVTRVARNVTRFGVYLEPHVYYSNDFVLHREYCVLEPTDIVHIPSEQGNAQRYRLVDRKAKVGDRIIIVDGKGWYRDKVGNIYEVIHSSKYGFEEDDDGRAYVEYEKNEYDEAIHYVRRENYRVLEPVEPAELVTAEEGDDKSVLDLLANLARRVTELERKFESIESRQKRLMGRIADTEEKIEMILDDIVTLDERTQPLVALVKAVKVDE
jgi:hypothetical protein